MVDVQVPKFLVEERETHPAAVAWRQLRPRSPAPQAIEVLCERRKGSGYRLVGAGDDGEDVIAKCSPNRIASVERAVYEQVLERTGLDLLRYYGSLEAGADTAWIFVEMATGEPWQHDNPEHAAVAGRWIAQLHIAAAAVARNAGLPDLSLRAQLARIGQIRQALQTNLANPSLTPADLVVLTSIQGALERLTTKWGRIESACRGVPATLVHGDFRPKNVRLRTRDGVVHLAAFDWETAGFGVPAADLARVDAAAYAVEVYVAWPQLDLSAVRQLAAVGALFRQLDAIRWEATGLHATYQGKRMQRMRIYLERLDEALRGVLDEEATQP